MAARSKAWVWGRSLARIAGSNSAGGMDVVSFVIVVGREVDVPASSLSLMQRSPTDCDASLCDRVASIMRGPWLVRGG